MDLVTIQGNQVLTSSTVVALAFDKKHYNVVRDIEVLIANMTALKIEGSSETEKNQYELTQRKIALSVEGFFIESKYKDASGKQNKCYLMTRDGFSLLVMGFTGQKALEWKLKYIEAFNYMEESLKKIGELSIADSREWELLKGSARSILMLKDKIQKDMKEIEKIIRRVDDHRQHLGIYGTQILEMMNDVENGKLRDINEY